MDAELNERVMECLRGLEIGESISADGIADEIGGKLSDVYDALEDLENATLVEMHPACRKGSDPTYTLTPKGKRHMQPEVQERPEPEPAKEEHDAPELRPSADRMCRFCGKVMEPNKVRRHENLCGKNPDSVSNTARRKATRDEAVVTNATRVLDFEVPMEGCADPPEESDFPAFPEALEQLNAEDPDVPDEVPDYSPANNAADQDTLLAGFLERVRAQDVLVLKGSPGMDAALRLISFCQQMVGSGAQVSVDATVQVTEGFHIHVDLCVPTGEPDE
jgi:DNA-binding MarR family transcriptional regulator